MSNGEESLINPIPPNSEHTSQEISTDPEEPTSIPSSLMHRRAFLAGLGAMAANLVLGKPAKAETMANLRKIDMEKQIELRSIDWYENILRHEIPKGFTRMGMGVASVYREASDNGVDLWDRVLAFRLSQTMHDHVDDHEFELITQEGRVAAVNMMRLSERFRARVEYCVSEGKKAGKSDAQIAEELNEDIGLGNISYDHMGDTIYLGIRDLNTNKDFIGEFVVMDWFDAARSAVDFGLLDPSAVEFPPPPSFIVDLNQKFVRAQFGVHFDVGKGCWLDEDDNEILFRMDTSLFVSYNSYEDAATGWFPS